MLYDKNLSYKKIDDDLFKTYYLEATSNTGIAKNKIIYVYKDVDNETLYAKKSKNKDNNKDVDLKKYELICKYYTCEVKNIPGFADDVKAISFYKIGSFLVSNDSNNDNALLEELLNNYEKEYASLDFNFTDDDYINNIKYTKL